MRIDVPQLPNRVRPHLKSIGQTAKQVATMIDENRNVIRWCPDKYVLLVTRDNAYRKLYCVTDSMRSPTIATYTYENFKQEHFFDDHGKVKMEKLTRGDQRCFISPNRIRVLHNGYPKRRKNYEDEVREKYDYIPSKPYLNITKDTGVWQTCYSGINSMPKQPTNLSEPELFKKSQRDFVEHQWPVGSPEAIYAKQYKIITKFLHFKNEAFDYVTNAYKKLEKDKDYEGEDLSAKGDRVEVKKQQGEQGAAFDVTFYDEEGKKKAMSGTFEIARDENEKPLKEAKDGTILKFGDPNYDDEQNELCFNVSNLNTYFEDIEVRNCAISREVVKVGNKYKNQMTMTMYGRNGTVEDSYSTTDVGNKAISRCSQDWLDKRYSKVYHGITKHDLKQAKHYLLSMRLNPADLKEIGCSPDSPDSLISQINADNLDSNDIRTPQPVAQEVQEANLSPDFLIASFAPDTPETPAAKAARIVQEKEFLANLAQEKPESFVAFNEYMVNMKPGVRDFILNIPINRRIGVMRNRLSKDANVALDAFNAFVAFKRQMEAQEATDAQVGQVAQEKSCCTIF